MKLYYHPNSPNCVDVLATANQLGIQLELQLVDLLKGAQKDPAYLKINPNGRVPTLVDVDFVLWESNAIMQYLASTKPNNPLWPATESAPTLPAGSSGRRFIGPGRPAPWCGRIW